MERSLLIRHERLSRRNRFGVQWRAASAIILAMNRRTFIYAAGATGLSLTSGFGLGATDSAVAVLLNLLEDSPRERIPRELVRLIRGGLRYGDLLSDSVRRL